MNFIFISLISTKQMIGYIYFLQMNNNIFKIVTNIGDIRNVDCIIKAKVSNPEEKKQAFHDLLYDETEELEQDLYRTTREFINKLIKLMDARDIKIIDNKNKNPKMKPDDMKHLFKDGRLIRCKDEIGVYDESRNAIVYDEVRYNSLSGFAKAICGFPVNGWNVCEYEGDDGWISVKKLKTFI